MFDRLCRWIAKSSTTKPSKERVRRQPYHFIRPGNHKWLPKWAAYAVLCFAITASAANVDWSISDVKYGGVKLNAGQAWLILGSDPSVTAAAIKAGTFNTAQGASLNKGAASGRVQSPAKKDVSAYVAVVYGDHFFVTPVKHGRAPCTLKFTAPCSWETVPEPGSLLLLAMGLGMVAGLRRVNVYKGRA